MKHNSKKFLSGSFRPIIILSTILLLVLIAYQFGLIEKFKSSKSKGGGEEIQQILAVRDLKVQSELYKNLILRVGPEQAQEELLYSGLPFDGQTHLLNHVVGDFIYEKFGTEGLPRCKDYFLSSCYHGFILHAIAAGGMPEVAKSFNECLKFGPTVSGQCAHAIGHGFLANAGYKNLTQALTTCDEAVATMPSFPGFNCYDGVFMENIWAVHDDGLPSPDRWVKEEDHFYPCNDKRIDPKYLLGCWSNQPSLAYQQFKGDVKKVGDEVCNKIKESDLQNMCFDGLARQIHPLTQGNVDNTFNLCGMMPSTQWVNYCISTNAGSAYSVGDRTTPFQICGKAVGEGKNECYQRLLGTIRGYKKENESMKNLCSKIIDESWRENCEQIN